MHDDLSGGSKQRRNPEDLTRLLLRLDPDTTRAGEKYEEIRRRQAKFFECNHCLDSDKLVDEVIDRVAAKLRNEEIRDVLQYCVAVARNVVKEARKKEWRITAIEELPGGDNELRDIRDREREIVDNIDKERRLACLRHCLARLTPDEQELVIEYYSGDGGKQVGWRQELAKKGGLSRVALRTRMTRLRTKLELCVKQCLESFGQRLSPASSK